MQKLYKHFNIRQMQAYAALCPNQYCLKEGIKHKYISQLIFHLVEILSAQDLPEWEQKGAALEITGRGDQLPQSIEELFDPITNQGVRDLENQPGT